MIGAIKYGLSHLGDFSGRDARQTFWYYVLFLVVIQFVFAIIASIPMYMDMFGTIFSAVEGGVDPENLEATMMGGMAESMRTQIWVGAVSGIVGTIFFIAAFVRRLHDGGFSGWLAIIPVATQAFATYHTVNTIDAVTKAMADGAGTDPAAMMAAQGNVALGFVGWIGYIFVIIFGVMKSDGPNRFGDKPVSF